MRQLFKLRDFGPSDAAERFREMETRKRYLGAPRRHLTTIRRVSKIVVIVPFSMRHTGMNPW